MNINQLPNATYQTPTVKVVMLNVKSHILYGSETIDYGGDGESDGD